MSNILSETQSICPYCLKKIQAIYVEKDDRVYMEKTCDDHGRFSTLVWHGVSHFKNWLGPLANVKTFNAKKIDKGCPYDCGICADHRQLTCCVLLEVTSRCDLNCPICFASSDTRGEDPSLDTISSWYDMLLENGGPFNIQLSGGEPTMRDDLATIISIGKDKGFTFFQLNTNGIRIGEEIEYLNDLVKAGLNTVFLQFDGFNEKSYSYLRGKNILENKLKAIENCKKANVGVVLVPTIKKGVNDDEVGEILKFAMKNIPVVRGVNFQPMSFFGRYRNPPKDEDRFTIPEMLNAIESQMEGKMRTSDFLPGNAEHSFCSFHSDYTIKEDEIIHNKSKSSNCCSSSENARNAVAHKWTLHKEPKKIKTLKKPIYRIDSLDAFLNERLTKTLSISGMAFQDVWNLDLERLKRCYIHEISKDGNLIPFCAYNLTSADGETLYRGKNGK